MLVQSDAAERSTPASPRLPGKLAVYSAPQTPLSIPDAFAWCDRLARSHYENFTVASWFLPKYLRKHFASIYAYCRIADDLGDEAPDSATALELLGWWERQLDAIYTQVPSASHPVFVALRETVRQFDIPRSPFADLITAFRQDQQVSRYETFAELLGYCRNSANPVGRLVLYLCGYRDEQRQQLSDATCTALQLANFWQDVSVDWGKGRVYIPQEDLRRFGVTEADIAARRATTEFWELMRFEVERTRELFKQGLPLVRTVDRTLAIDIELFTRGGQAILNEIERAGYDVLTKRPTISKRRKLTLLARAALAKVAR